MAATKRKAAKKPAARKTTTKKKPAAKKTTRKPAAKAKKASTKVRVVKKKAPAKKKTAAKKTTVKKAAPSLRGLKTAMTRSQQVGYLAECADMKKADMNALSENILDVIKAHLKGPGEISLFGLFKVVVVRKPATKARKGINPFTGEPTIFKAKPARNVIKIRPLKKIKDLV